MNVEGMTKKLMVALRMVTWERMCNTSVFSNSDCVFSNTTGEIWQKFWAFAFF